MTDSKHAEAAYKDVEKDAKTSELPKFLTYLVFQGHSVRIGLELTACIFLYVLLKISLPWELLGVNAKWQSLTAWFAACASIAAFDQLVLCRSVYILRRCYRLDISGSYDRALSLLELIAPDAKGFIPCPKALYHLCRAQILSHAERFDVAEAELVIANASGLNTEQYYVSRSELFRQQGAFERARKELKEVEVIVGKTPLVALEEALVLLEEREDFRAAKRALRAVLEMPDLPHPSGETTTAIAKAYFEVARLRTGEAEAGFEGLNRSVQHFRAAARYIETLRPIAASLLLERGYYLATHGEPEDAVRDLKIAEILCVYPNLKRRAEEIADELEWRYQMKVTD